MCVAIPVKLFFEEFSMAHKYIHTESNYEARRREIEVKQFVLILGMLKYLHSKYCESQSIRLLHS